MEDIINRGGGNILIRVFRALENEERDLERPVKVTTDGYTRSVPAGTQIRLTPGESFQTPEAILSFSTEGLNALSRNYHRVIREQVIAPRWRHVKKPVLVNSWEACYFDFDAEKILELAGAAKELGMEMLVLDDGWFGKRNDDTTSLGDWVCNEGKLGCSLKELSERIHCGWSRK